MKYDVFISYSREDLQIVKQFVSEISNAGFNVWLDKKGIAGGDHLTETIVKAIKDSAIIVFFSSEKSNQSKWTVKEIKYALKKGKTIIPIRLDNAEYHDSIDFELIDITDIAYDADEPTSTFQELISSIEDKIRKPATTAPTKSPEELFEIGKAFADKKDYENAIKNFTSAAELGHAAAQFSLGYF